MKLIIVTVLTLFYSGVAPSAIVDVIMAEWIEFKLEHAKLYDSLAQEEYRLNVYLDNRQFIAQHNQRFALGLESYEMSLNQFSDLTYEEFLEQYASSNVSTTFDYMEDSEQIPDDEETTLTAFDWRTKPGFGPVKNQGNCGSCWAFGALTTLEHHLRILKGQTVVLSEQQLVDCTQSLGNHGCNGGSVELAYRYIWKQGVASEKSYPYTARNGQCRYQPGMKATSIKGFVRVNGENTMQDRLQRIGPLAVLIHVSRKFQFYRGGIFDQPNCPHDVNHAVVIVGFGDSQGSQYWIVQNSWGSRWGEHGFILMSKNKNNQCAINSHVVYPILR